MLKVGECNISKFVNRAFENGAILQVAIGYFPDRESAENAEKRILRNLKLIIEKYPFIGGVTLQVPRICDKSLQSRKQKK